MFDERNMLEKQTLVLQGNSGDSAGLRQCVVID